MTTPSSHYNDHHRRRLLRHRHPHRGISNVHGTSCHTSSALQLLFHCFPKVTEALLQLAPICAEYYWIEKYTADDGALAPQREQHRRNHQYQRQIREENNIVASDNKNHCMDETDCENGRLKKSAPSESSSIIHREFVYQLSWFFHLLAYSIDVLQISKDKAAVVMKARHQKSVSEMKVKEKQRKKATNNSNDKNAKETSVSSSKSKMSAYQRATIKDFKSKSRAGKLSMDDWELLVMTMKDVNKDNIQYSVACSADMSLTRNKNVGGNESRYADKEDITSPDSIYNASNNNDCTNSSSNTNSSNCIDPTNFYQYLSSYDDNFSPLDNNNNNNNEHNTRRKNASLAINTNNVGDAAIVFRCLVGALETSVKDELSRMRDNLDTLNEGQTKDDLEEGQKRNDNNDRGPSEKELLLLLEQVQLAMRHSWSGTLVSRIVGTHSTTTTTSSPNRGESDPNKPPTQSTTTTIFLQRTKKNGNLERPLPVPFPLPVINRQDTSNGTVLGPTNYFDNLEQAFHSVTIYPIPIRGYDWSELIHRGEVIEEQYGTKVDEDEISVVEKDLTECNDDIKATSTFTGAGENDIESSRSIACQTDSFGYDIGTQTFSGENSLMEVPFSNQQQEDRNMEESGGKEEYSHTTALLEAKFGVSKSSCYAAAVAALVLSNQGTSVASRHSRVRRPPRKRTNAEESRGGRRKSEASAGSDGNNALGMENGTLSGMEIDALAEDDDQQDDAEDEAQSPSECSSSEEESSVDSHVSSVDTDTSSKENVKNEERDDDSFSTRSSAIETPPDIDNLSLGSFTDSDLELDEKEDNDNAVIRVTVPAVKSASDKVKDMEESLETMDEYQEGSEFASDIDESKFLVVNSGDGLSTAKKVIESQEETQIGPSAIATAAFIDFDADKDTGAIRCNVNESTSSSTTTTSSASSTTSYSSTDDTSSTDSARSSSDDSSISTSDDDELDIDNSQQDMTAAGWITRKETRLRLPLPQSLIFHLKRFEYSATTGRVEKLTGSVDIPHKLNVRGCCLDRTVTNLTKHDISTMRDDMHSCCFEYYLSGAIVHVDPKEMEDEIEFGRVSEGHYVTLLHSPSSRATSITDNDPNHYEREDEVGTWTEIDDEMIRIVRSESETTHSRHPALDTICGCDKYYNGTDSECRCAMLLVYSRTCGCFIE
jgi:hypothetical protein